MAQPHDLPEEHYDTIEDRQLIVSNHTGYDHQGSSNFEHDDTGAEGNFSGVEDEFNSAEAEHEGWQEGFDY